MTSNQTKRLTALTAIAVAVAVLFAIPSLGQKNADEARFRSARETMVRRDIASAKFGRTPVRDEAVLDAMRTVLRHKFVPEWLQPRAYDDTPWPIGQGQTISQPYIVAVMTEALQPKPGHVILEIGTGSGYQAAVLGEIVKKVYTIEIVPELGKQAAATLRELGYDNVEARIGDGYQGWPEHGPFDGIIVTAAPDHIPQPLVEQLKRGGRMVIPVGPRNDVQELILLEKDEEGVVRKRTMDLVRFVPLTGESERK